MCRCCNHVVVIIVIHMSQILYEYHLEDLPLISHDEYDHLIKYFAYDVYARSFLKSLGAETIVDVSIPSGS